MDEVDKITWEDSPPDVPFSSIGTCDEGVFCIVEHAQPKEFGYALAFASAPMGIVDGKRVGQDIQPSELDYIYVAGGKGEDENWARSSAKMRANKHRDDEFPTVTDVPKGFYTATAAPTQATGNSTGETAPAGAKAPTQSDSTPAGEGHNAVNAKQVSEFVNRIERLTHEKSEINEAIKDVYAEAEAYGHPAKVLRKVVQLRKEDPDRLAEFEGQLSFYRELIGI